jgi:hypothetical protein
MPRLHAAKLTATSDAPVSSSSDLRVKSINLVDPARPCVFITLATCPLLSSLTVKHVLPACAALRESFKSFFNCYSLVSSSSIVYTAKHRRQDGRV